MPMARSASHAAHCVRKGETPSRSQEDLMDHWSTTQIGQKGWNFLTSLQGEMQTVEELVSHVAEKWAGTGSRLGSDVTILSPQTVGVGQLQFQVKKENVLVGGNLVRRIYFYSFIAQEDDMEAHATAAVMGYLFHLCLDIQAHDNPLDPDETQQLLGVAHAIRDAFVDWKERFCVLKAMIKALAQRHRKKRTKARRENRLTQQRRYEELTMGATVTPQTRALAAPNPPHRTGGHLGPGNVPVRRLEGTQGPAKAEEQSPWDEEDPSLHPLTFCPSGSGTDAHTGVGAQEGADKGPALKGEQGNGPGRDTWTDHARELAHGAHAPSPGTGTPHASSTMPVQHGAEGRTDGTSHVYSDADPSYSDRLAAASGRTLDTSGTPHVTPGTPGAVAAHGYAAGARGTPSGTPLPPILPVSGKRTAGQAGGADGGSAWGTPGRGRTGGRSKRERWGDQQRGGVGHAQRRDVGGGGGPMLVVGRGGPMSRILGAVGDLGGLGAEEEDVDVC